MWGTSGGAAGQAPLLAHRPSVDDEAVRHGAEGLAAAPRVRRQPPAPEESGTGEGPPLKQARCVFRRGGGHLKYRGGSLRPSQECRG